MLKMHRHPDRRGKNIRNITTKQYVEKEKSKAILPIMIYIAVVIKVICEAFNCIKNHKLNRLCELVDNDD